MSEREPVDEENVASAIWPEEKVFTRHEPVRDAQVHRTWGCTCGDWRVFSGNIDFLMDSFAVHLRAVAVVLERLAAEDRAAWAEAGIE